jgi:hypothetical protein
MFETRQSTQVYCRSTCRPHRQGQRTPQASSAARGYDSQRVRDDDIAFVDSLLDAYNDLARG